MILQNPKDRYIVSFQLKNVLCKIYLLLWNQKSEPAFLNLFHKALQLSMIQCGMLQILSIIVRFKRHRHPCLIQMGKYSLDNALHSWRTLEKGPEPILSLGALILCITTSREKEREKERDSRIVIVREFCV